MKILFTKRALLLSALFIFFTLKLFAQDQKNADSLISVYNNLGLDVDEKLKCLRDISIDSTDPLEQMKYANLLLELASKEGDDSMIIAAYTVLGGSYSKIGQLENSLEVLFKGAKHAESTEMKVDLGSIYGQIASTYSHNGDLRNSLLYKKKSLKLFEEENNLIYIGYGSLNIGYEYYKLIEYDSALFYTNKALTIFETLEFEAGIAYAKGNTGLIKWKQHDYLVAQDFLLEAINKLRPLEDYYAMADYLHNLGRIYYQENKIQSAIEVTSESLEMARSNDLKEQERDASLLLSQLYEGGNNTDKSLLFHKKYVALKDSIQSNETTQKMADQRIQFEVGQKQAEVDLLTAEQKIQRIILYATAAFAFVFIVLAAIIYKYYRSKNKVNKILAQQKLELEKLNQTKDKFFSIISHDVRGPVASFNGIGHMIKFFVKSKETDQLLEVADHIDQSVDQLSKLLDNLLAWAMQQQGQFPNAPEKLNLNELAEDLVKTLSNMAEGKKISLTSSIEPSIHLWADRNSTMTILRNLVSNSLKFTPEGGSVSIEAIRNDDFAEIRVVDSGIGIPKDKLEKLFQLEDKKSTYGTSGEKGLGLGLQLVHEFLEMNNGSIKVESKEGNGTTFIISLPLFETKS